MAVCSGLTNRKSSSQIFRKVSSFFAKPSMGIWWVLSPNKQKMYNCHLSLRPLSHTMLLTTFSNHRFMSRDFFTLVSLYIFPCQFFTGVQLSECLEWATKIWCHKFDHISTGGARGILNSNNFWIGVCRLGS